jgi:hypothetical protein
MIGGEVLIFRPREAVFDVVADERHEPAFNPRMAHVELISGEPLGTGSRVSATASWSGRATGMTIEYTTLERPSRLGSRTTMASMIIDGELTFEEAPGGTHLSWSWDVRPTRFRGLLGPIVTRIGKRQEAQCWEGLKRYLETEEHSSAH